VSKQVAGNAKLVRNRFLLPTSNGRAKLSRRGPLGAGLPMPAQKSLTKLISTDFRTLLNYLVEFSGIAITYLAVAKLSLALASIHPSATPIATPFRLARR
jgi:hypothetical protein